MRNIAKPSFLYQVAASEREHSTGFKRGNPRDSLLSRQRKAERVSYRGFRSVVGQKKGAPLSGAPFLLGWLL
jgi:hypothetical protein